MAHVATIGTATSSSAVSTLSATLTAVASTGHTVVGAVVWESGAGSIPTVSSITDSRSNTYTIDVSAGGSGNVTDACIIFRARVTTALQVGDTITVNISSGTRNRWLIQADDFDDVDASPLDVTQHTDNPGAATSLTTGATATTAQAYELLYAVFAFPAARGPVTPGTGWTAGALLEATNRALQALWMYTSSTGAQTATATLTASGTYCGAIAAYKATSTSPPVAQVSQVALEVPQASPAPVAQVSQVAFTVPQGALGVVQVSQVRLTVPALAGQPPYSGLKIADGGTLRNVALQVARNGSV